MLHSPEEISMPCFFAYSISTEWINDLKDIKERKVLNYV